MSQKLATQITAALVARALPYVAVYVPADDESVDSEIAIKRDGQPVPFSLQLDAHGSCLNRYYGACFGGAEGEEEAVQTLAMFGRGEDAKAAERLVSELATYHGASRLIGDIADRNGGLPIDPPATPEPVIEAIAAKALYLYGTEDGSADAIAAGNAFWVAVEPLMTAEQFAPFEAMKAPHDAMIVEALGLAGTGVSALDLLTAEYEVYCDRAGLPAMSADALVLELESLGKDTPERRAWFADFIDRWEAEQIIADAERDTKREAFAAQAVDMTQGNPRVRVADLRIGQRVDLENDMFADPEGYAAADTGDGESGHPEFAFEFEQVLAVVHERHDVDPVVRVDFMSGFSCGFPPDHLVDIDGEQTFPESLTEARHDMGGYYLLTAAEAAHEDAGYASVGFDGRQHWPTLEAAQAALSAEDEPAMEILHCDKCGDPLEAGQIGLCEACLNNDDDLLVECGNCGWRGLESEGDVIQDIGQRVSPGEAMPACECPDCGALCHVVEDQGEATATQAVAGNVRDALKAFVHQRDYFAAHARYDQTTFHPDADQLFDDWAADIAETLLAQPLAPPVPVEASEWTFPHGGLFNPAADTLNAPDPSCMLGGEEAYSPAQALNTVLAALTHYQDEQMGDPENRPDHIHAIACNETGHEDVSLDERGIAGLAYDLNECNLVLIPRAELEALRAAAGKR